MNRRSILKNFALMLASKAVYAEAAAEPATAQGKDKAIVLYCDLAIDPADERAMLENFHRRFKPAAMKFDGYIDLKMVKLRKLIQGSPAPEAGINYRFQLTYESEEKRQKWIASDVHKRVWPLIENVVKNRDYIVLLTDNA